MQSAAEERLMYAVMKAIHESGIPVSFKGSLVLKACLAEAGYTEEIWHTVDIDANNYAKYCRMLSEFRSYYGWMSFPSLTSINPCSTWTSADHKKDIDRLADVFLFSLFSHYPSSNYTSSHQY